MKPRPILLVDDSPDDRELALAALREHKLLNEIICLNDGVECLDCLHRRGQFLGRSSGDPVLILLDLKMPRADGMEVLREVKADPRFKTIPVVVMTSSREQRDLIESYELGVSAYVVKPLRFEDFLGAVKVIGGFWAILNELPIASDGAFST